MLTSVALGARGIGAVTTAPGCIDGPACTVYNSSAVKSAVAEAGTVLVFMGSGGVTEREMLDQASLEFHGNQTLLLADTIAAAPLTATVVVILLTCTPLNITGMVLNGRIGAIIQAFYPQASGGLAIASAILGECSTASSCFGRLPYTWPVTTLSHQPLLLLCFFVVFCCVL